QRLAEGLQVGFRHRGPRGFECLTSPSDSSRIYDNSRPQNRQERGPSGNARKGYTPPDDPSQEQAVRVDRPDGEKLGGCAGWRRAAALLAGRSVLTKIRF